VGPAPDRHRPPPLLRVRGGQRDQPRPRPHALLGRELGELDARRDLTVEPGDRADDAGAVGQQHVDVPRLRFAGRGLLGHEPRARRDQLLHVVEHLGQQRAPQRPGRQLATAPLRRPAALEVDAGEPVAQQAVADGPALQRVQGDRQRVAGVVVAVADRQPHALT
jgi:hypothetical protein